MLKDKKFGVISLGCDKNRVDTEKMLAMIASRGCLVTDDPAEAQILIVNTCGFLESARTEAIETVLEFAEYKQQNLEKIVVTGCLPQKFIDELFEPLTEADVFLGVTDYEKLFEAIEASYKTRERQNYVGTGKEVFRVDRVQTTDPHYAYLKIADGCYNHCTYCLIPKIRGKYRSYPMEGLIEEARELGELSELIVVAQDIIFEAKQLASNGIKELIVVAQDTTRYGEDLYGKNCFVELLQKLSALENVEKIRLLYCYPDVITDELIEEIASNDKILKYLDIPLQHSENRVLKLMNRKGTREQYLALFEKLRSRIPNIAIRSTFISGFPTETEEEFEGMLDFLRQAQLINCGFFAYSREPFTGAYRLKPQVHHKTKERRVRALYECQREISASILSRFIGQEIEVLCDGIDYEKSCFVGRAYFNAPDIDGKIYFHAAEAMQGEYYKVFIESADGYDFYGRTEDYQL